MWSSLSPGTDGGESEHGGRHNDERGPTWQADVRELLAFLGEAISAKYLVLSVLIADPDSVNEPDVTARTTLVWHSDGPAAESRLIESLDRSQPPYFVPVLKDDLSRYDVTYVVPLDIWYPLEAQILVGHNADTEYAGKAYDRLINSIVSGFLEGRHDLYNRKAAYSLQENVFNVSKQPMLVTSSGLVLHANPACEPLFGRTIDQIVDSSFISFFPAEDLERLNRKLHEWEERRSETAINLTIYRPDGDLPVEISGAPLEWRGRSAALLVVQDVSPFDRTDNYLSLVRTVSEGVWRIKLANPVSRRLPLETQVTEIIRSGTLEEFNSEFAEMLHPFDLAEGDSVRLFAASGVYRLVKAFIESNYRLEQYKLVMNLGGRRRSYLVNARGQRTTSGLTSIWGTVTDVSNLTARVSRSDLVGDKQAQIARSLNDRLGKLLERVSDASSEVIDGVGSDSLDLSDRLSSISRFAEEATTRLRNIYVGLIPKMLVEADLPTALQHLMTSVGEVANVDATVVDSDAVVVASREDRLRICKVVQAAVDQAVQWAGASTIRVSVDRTDGMLRARIEHDAAEGRDLQRYFKEVRSSLAARSEFFGARITMDSGVERTAILQVEFKDC